MDSKTAGPTVSGLQDSGADAAALQAPRSSVSRRLGTLGLGLPMAESRGPAASKLRDSIFRRTLLVADALAILGAFLLTRTLFTHSQQLTWTSIIGLPVLFGVAKVMGLYDRDDTLLRKTTLDEAPKLFQLATLFALLAWMTAGSIGAGALDRRQALILWLALAILLVVMRTIARAVALRVAPAERCLFVGDADAARTIRSKMSNHGGVRADLVAHLDFDKIAPWSTDTHSEAKLAEVRDLARKLDVHRAIVAPRSADANEVLDLVRTLKAVGVRVSVLPRLLEAVGSSVEFDDLHGVTVMGVRRFDLTRSSAALKRSFDLLFASIGLLAVSPLVIALAIAIKLDSRGPVFFGQQRVGQYGKRFRILKFRTMIVNADAQKDALRHRNEAREGMFKIADDPRITRVGSFLRKSSLDELPQLLNVLRGEMSLVGPRPLILEEDVRIEGWHRRRLELTPGMTGPWQILGPVRVPLGEMVAIDYLYAANWSLWTDVKIVLRTFSYVLERRGV